MIAGGFPTIRSAAVRTACSPPGSSARPTPPAGDAEVTARQVAATDEAVRTLALGPGHVHPDDIAYATRCRRLGFAMEVRRVDGHLVLEAVRPAAQDEPTNVNRA